MSRTADDVLDAMRARDDAVPSAERRPAIAPETSRGYSAGDVLGFMLERQLGSFEGPKLDHVSPIPRDEDEEIEGVALHDPEIGYGAPTFSVAAQIEERSRRA